MTTINPHLISAKRMTTFANNLLGFPLQQTNFEAIVIKVVSLGFVQIGVQEFGESIQEATESNAQLFTFHRVSSADSSDWILTGTQLAYLGTIENQLATLENFTLVSFEGIKSIEDDYVDRIENEREQNEFDRLEQLQLDAWEEKQLDEYERMELQTVELPYYF